MPAISTYAGDLALLASGVPGWTLPHVDLFTNTPTTGKRAVIGDFTIPTYTGYAQAAVTFGTAYISGETQLATVLSSDASWIGPTAGPGTDVTGWVLSDGTTHTVWAWGTFDGGPISLNLPTDRISELDVIIGQNTAMVQDVEF
jgi:hypothetical protein